MPKWDGVVEPVGEIAALKRQDQHDIAQETLEKVYRYVLPIMKKHKYRVHKLREFLPKKANLLGINVNHGQTISLRLRYSHNPKEFLPFESVLGTMLHELCHNTFGPHDNNFFALLDTLTNEMEDMMAKGFRGDPFIGNGRVIGVMPRNLNTPLRATRAGSKTAMPVWNPPKSKTTRPIIGSGFRLGGLATRVNKNDPSTRRNLLYQAAERRRQAELACKAVDKASQLAQDEQEEVIDLTEQDIPKEPKKPKSPSASPIEVISLLDDDD